MGVKDTYPAATAAAITPSDTVAITGGPARAVYVGVGGNVVIVGEDGVATTFTGALAGSILPVRTVRVNATSTTATNLVALF